MSNQSAGSTADNSPVDDSSIDKSPIGGSSGAGAPVADLPAGDSTVADSPADYLPVNDLPVDDLPADDLLPVVTAVDIRRTAMDLLARREHSFRELHNKLLQRFGATPLIDTELQRLREERLQSDDRFVEAYVYSRARRLYGPLRIKAELRERGISDTVIAASLSPPDIDWQANLQQLLDTRFGGRPAADFKEKAKRLRFLQYRGFSAEHIGEFVL